MLMSESVSYQSQEEKLFFAKGGISSYSVFHRDISALSLTLASSQLTRYLGHACCEYQKQMTVTSTLIQHIILSLCKRVRQVKLWFQCYTFLLVCMHLCLMNKTLSASRVTSSGCTLSVALNANIRISEVFPTISWTQTPFILNLFI